ncbi:FAD-dependent oxidoreductase [Eubacteriaceae bacterium ES2]|nr:FAD-dependent oxidoreductase [Eubacteriaceae bacterium ES2]
MKIVVIGASAAGISAIKSIREIDQDAQITMISKEKDIHSRCMLHHCLSGHRNQKSIDFAGSDFCTDKSVSWLKGLAVTGVDPQKKFVKIEDGQEIKFDKLLIASGAAYFIPPVPGLREAKNVFGFRDLADVKRINDHLRSDSRVVIIGSGLVGMDVASALNERGIKNTVVEMMPDILPLQLDGPSASVYQILFEENGTDFLLSEKVTELKLDENRIGTSLMLESGKNLEADLVIVAAGVRPETAFLEGSGIECDRGIVVDEKMQTSQADIYAAGDVTGLSGIWPNAMKQGRVAAQNIMGRKAVYDDRFAIKNTINFYGCPTLSLGQICPDQDTKVYIREDRNSYQKILLKDQMIEGLILQGNLDYAGFWQVLIKNKITIDERTIFDLEYSDFYAINEKNGAFQLAF